MTELESRGLPGLVLAEELRGRLVDLVNARAADEAEAAERPERMDRLAKRLEADARASDAVDHEVDVAIRRGVLRGRVGERAREILAGLKVSVGDVMRARALEYRCLRGLGLGEVRSEVAAAKRSVVELIERKTRKPRYAIAAELLQWLFAEAGLKQRREDLEPNTLARFCRRSRVTLIFDWENLGLPPSQLPRR